MNDAFYDEIEIDGLYIILSSFDDEVTLYFDDITKSYISGDSSYIETYWGEVYEVSDDVYDVVNKHMGGFI